MGDGADGGSCKPGQPKEPTETTQGTNQQQVKVKARALEQPPGLLTDDEPANGRGSGMAGQGTCSRHSLHTHKDRNVGEGRADTFLPGTCQLPLSSSQIEVLTLQQI